MLTLAIKLELNYKQVVQLIVFLLMFFASWFQSRFERGGFQILA